MADPDKTKTFEATPEVLSKNSNLLSGGTIGIRISVGLTVINVEVVTVSHLLLLVLNSIEYVVVLVISNVGVPVIETLP